MSEIPIYYPGTSKVMKLKHELDRLRAELISTRTLLFRLHNAVLLNQPLEDIQVDVYQLKGE